MIKYYINKVPVYGPPYTKEEEADFYSRQGVSTMLTVPAKPPVPKKDDGLTVEEQQMAKPNGSPRPSFDSITPERLAQIGELLYGVRWKTAMAQDLGLDRHTVIGWHDGQWKISTERATDIRGLVHQRINQLQAVLK